MVNLIFLSVCDLFLLILYLCFYRSPGWKVNTRPHSRGPYQMQPFQIFSAGQSCFTDRTGTFSFFPSLHPYKEI